MNDFCKACGARIPPIVGEGTCQVCDPGFVLSAGDGTCGDLDPECVDAVFSEPRLGLGNGVGDDQVVDSVGPGDGRWNWFGLAPEEPL